MDGRKDESVDSPALAVIIPARNEERDLPAVLGSLAPLREATRVEVIVADVDSSDRTPEIALQHSCRVIDVGLVPPGVARNRAVADAATAEVIAFIDGDVVVESEWIERVLELLAEDRPLVGVVTGFPYGVRTDAGWIERTWFDPRDREPPTYVSAGNLILRRDEFLELGGFDERLPTGEDYELCARAGARGMTVRLDERLRTVHLGNPRTAGEFLVREAWHGTGDFVSLQRVLQSRVALATVGFLGFLVLALVGLLMGSGLMAAVGVTGVATACLGSAWLRSKRAGLSKVLAAAPVYFLYFAGRSLSIFVPTRTLSEWRSKG